MSRPPFPIGESRPGESSPAGSSSGAGRGQASASDADTAATGVDDPYGYERFHLLARRLRDECPWDVEQTHQSLVRYLIEETYEVVDAIAALDAQDPTTDAALVEELGDLLYQIEFHAAIASQEGRFTIADVTAGIHDKLVRRHPHVFAGADIDGIESVNQNWDAIKRAEKPDRQSVLDGIARSLPGLSQASEVQRKAAKVGFDWASPAESAAKVVEELSEVAAANEDGDPDATAAEIGDLLFAVVNLARHVGVDPESSLRAATNKFEHRFRSIERTAQAAQVKLESLSREEWLGYWTAAKAIIGHDSADDSGVSPTEQPPDAE